MFRSSLNLQLGLQNSPVLNPVDNAVWRALQQKMYQQHVSSPDELKEKIQ